MGRKDVQAAIDFIDAGDASAGRLELPGLTQDEAGEVDDYADREITPTHDGYRVAVIQINGVYCIEIYPEPS